MHIYEANSNSLITAQPAPGPGPGYLSDQLLAWSDRYRIALFSLVLLIYLAGFNGQWRVEPDSALYLSVARNLATGEGYTYRGEPHHLAYPGLPYFMAATFKIVGVESLWPAHVIMALIGLATLGLTYRLFLLHADRPTAVIITCGVGLTRTFYEFAFRLMTEMPFLMGVMAFFVGYESLYAARRRRDNPTAGRGIAGQIGNWLLMAAGIGIVVVMRPAMWVFLPVAAIGMIGPIMQPRSRSRRGIFLSILIFILLAFVFTLIRGFGGESEPGSYERIVREQLIGDIPLRLREIIGTNIPHLFGEIAANAVFGIELGHRSVNAVAGIVLIALGIGLVRRRALWGIWVAATVLMMVLVLPVDRYFLPILPLLVFAWWQSIRWLNHRLPPPWGNVIFGFLLILGTAPNLIKVGDFIIEQRSTPFLKHYKNGRYEPMIAVGERIKKIADPEAIILAPDKHARVITCFSGRNVFESNDAGALDFSGKEVYVILDPADEKMRRWVDQFHLQSGPAMMSVARPRDNNGHKQQPLTLHRAHGIE